MIAASSPLKTYQQKRNFTRTPEPAPDAQASRRKAGVRRPQAPRFVVQKHDARRLHYDFRLEADGVLKSWAVPKGPSINPANKRLAVRTEDHPIGYLKFEGVIPEGEYGAGSVIVWDIGTYRSLQTDSRGREIPMSKCIDEGKVEVELHGKKLTGGWSLIRTRGSDRAENWLLMKKRDETADVASEPVDTQPQSVLSGRTIETVVAGPKRPGQRREKSTNKRVGGSNGKPKPSDQRIAQPRPAAAQPLWIEPMLATLTDPQDFPARFEGVKWIVERKFDGFRALAFRRGSDVRLLSRNQKSLAEKFPEIVAALQRQPLDDFIVDGEVVGLDGNQVRFEQLQQRLKPVSLEEARKTGVKLRYFAFDLLYAGGFDLRDLPLIERKRLLKNALKFDTMIRFSAHKALRRRAQLNQACAQGWEGLIVKDANARYISGRTTAWLKLKCDNRQEFVIGGYTDPSGSRIGFGALLVGHYDGGTLRYAGKVGTGYAEETLRSLAKQLSALKSSKPAFSADPGLPKRNVHWVRPTLVAEIQFSDWTNDGKLRHPRFLGLRPDKDPAQVVRERPLRPSNRSAQS